MTHFIVSARKYRPARFEDVLGQDHISRTLKMALATDKMAQAFLFTGPRGVGKTTCARILAKALNCTALTSDCEPCGQCASCKAFDENASFSIFELDGASNNSVDQIRSLIEQVRFPPQSGKYKIFIIDEVHMLSTQAFNAFLKTLEEPPSYVVFILATTEKHKIIPTILSRCQIFDFKRIGIRDIVVQLRKIAEQEGIEADEDALHLIASKADGAMRDALSIFDRIAGGNEGKISIKAVIDNLNLLDYTQFFKLTDMMSARQLPEVMVLLDSCISAGFDPEVILGGLSEHLRQLLMCKDVRTLPLIENAESVVNRYKEQAAMVPTPYILNCLDLANVTEINLKSAKNKRLCLEMAFIKMVYLHDIYFDTPAPTGIDHVIPRQDSGQSRPQTKDSESKVEIVTTEDRIEDIATEPVINNQKQTDTEPEVISGQVSNVQEQTDSAPEVFSEPEVENKGISEPAPENIPKVEVKKGKVQNPAPMNLSQFEEEVEQQDDTEADMFSQEDFTAAWTSYRDDLNPGFLKTVMSERIFEVSDKDDVLIKVASNFERAGLLGEPDLLEYLRGKLKYPKLRLNIVIDEDLITHEAPAMPKTAQEKYNLMVDKNPKVKSLFEDLDLELEN
jgi:DNA polymerase-3 subunit gamma/tau